MSTDLNGITLIDLAGMGPSARCVRVLADLGARWIRLQPPAAANRMAGDWPMYGGLRGAEIMEFDLKHPAAKSLYQRLVSRADIVVEGFRPGVADRLGIGYRDSSETNPGIVYCAATGYGQTGPMARDVGHDINYQAMGGGLALAGRDSQGLPAIPGLTLADSAGGGWQGALRIMAALVERSRTGKGKFVDISAAEGMLHLMALAVDQQLATGECAGESVLYGNYACYGLYKTSDDKFIAVGAIETKFFNNLCRVLGLADKASLQYRADAQEELRHQIAAVFKTKPRDHWVEIFKGVDACLTPVLEIDELRQHPQWQARSMFVDYTHPLAGPACQVGPLGGGSERGEAPHPEKSACREILSEIGCDEQEISALIASGVVG